MTPHWLAAAGIATLAASMSMAMAQTNAPLPTLPTLPTLSASAPAATKPGPRLQTPTEQRDAGTTPGDLRPEERITPQVVVPLRKATSTTKAERADARRGRKAPPGAIDDAAARCEAEATSSAREGCRAGVAHPPKAPPAR